MPKHAINSLRDTSPYYPSCSPFLPLVIGYCIYKYPLSEDGGRSGNECPHMRGAEREGDLKPPEMLSIFRLELV